MKKIIAALLIAAGAYSYANAQGLVEVYNIGGGNANMTNGATSTYNGGTQTGGTSATAPNVANGFYYALLTSAFGGPAPAANPATGPWTLSLMATNYLVNGGIRAAGGASGTAVSGWAGGQTDYIELVGWSASLGTTWSQVSAEIASGNFIANGFLGVSPVAEVTAATSPSPATSIFGGTGLSSGITMYAVTPTPEPATMALAALGGASLLLFRRKK